MFFGALAGSAIGGLGAGLIAWWDFEEATGTRYDSRYGIPAHLEYPLALSGGTGKVGTAILNSANPAYLAYCRVPDRTIANFGSDGSWTIVGWTKIGDYAGSNAFYAVVGKYTFNFGGFWLYYSDSTFTFRTYDGASAQNMPRNLPSLPIAGDWVFFEFGYDAVTGKKFLRLNNSAATESTNTFTKAPDAYLALGSGAGSDSFAFWQRVLTNDERNRLYASGVGVDATEIGSTLPTAPTITKNLVCDGNSLTEGNGALILVDDYPTRLLDLLGRDWQKTNIGIGGQTTLAMRTIASDATAAYDGAKSRNVCVCWEITNSIFFGHTQSAIQSDLQTYISDRISEGYTVYTMTCLPRSTGSFSAPQEAIRIAVNAHMLANPTLYGGTGHVIDVASIVELSDANDSTYYYDVVHLTPRGYMLIAIAVAAVVGA